MTLAELNKRLEALLAQHPSAADALVVVEIEPADMDDEWSTAPVAGARYAHDHLYWEDAPRFVVTINAEEVDA